MLEHSAAACGRSRAIAPFSLHLGSTRWPVISFTSRQVYVQRKDQQAWSGRIAEGKIPVPRRGFQPRIYQPIA